MLDQFVPIEVMVPNWLDAREVMAKAIPNQIRFIPNPENPNSMVLDWFWCVEIARVAPDAARPAVIKVLQQAVDTVSNLIPLGLFERFLNQPMDQSLQYNLNAELRMFEKGACGNGAPTLIEVLEHMVGLKMSLTLARWELNDPNEEVIKWKH